MPPKRRLSSVEALAHRGRALHEVTAARPGVRWWSGPELDVFAYADGAVEVWLRNRLARAAAGQVTTGVAADARSAYAGPHEDVLYDEAPDPDTLAGAIALLSGLLEVPAIAAAERAFVAARRA